jgi:hypothetical protein
MRRAGRTRFHFSPTSLKRGDLPTVIRDFAEDRRGRALAHAYFGTRRILTHLPYYMAEVMEPAIELESWHVDCLRRTIKIFLALDDIGPNQAPLRYVPGSHRVDETMHRLFYDISRSGLGSAYYEASDCACFDRVGVPIIAPANHLFVVDNRGIHAGSLVKQGLRISLTMGYRPYTSARVTPRQFKDPKPMPYPWDRAKDS